jgi:hypothetical protein
MMRQLILNNIAIESRKLDNFINATQMCKAGGKKFHDWCRLSSSKELIKMLENSLKNEGINTEKYSIGSGILSSINLNEIQCALN